MIMHNLVGILKYMENKWPFVKKVWVNSAIKAS